MDAVFGPGGRWVALVPPGGEMGTRHSTVVDDSMCQGHGPCRREAPDVSELRGCVEHAVGLADLIPEARVVAARRALGGCRAWIIREVSDTNRS